MSKTETVYKCDACAKTFKTVSNLIVHINKFHKNQEKNKCTYCAQFFPIDKTLSMHVTTVHHNESQKRTLERVPSMTNHKQNYSVETGIDYCNHS